jgi:hypothetical protein
MSDNSPDEPTNSKLSSAINKHIYFDEQINDIEDLTPQKIIERSTPSTVRVDSSDLISRCKDFIPLLSDTNQSLTEKIQLNESDLLEKDDEEITIPDDDSSSEKSAKESGEASSTTDDDEKQIEVNKKKRKKKKKKKKKKLKTNDLNQDDNVNQ